MLSPQEAVERVIIRLNVCGQFDDRQRVKIREICQQVLDEPFCRVPNSKPAEMLYVQA